MAMQNWNSNGYRFSQVERVLNNAWTTIGKEEAERLGIVSYRGGGFNYKLVATHKEVSGGLLVLSELEAFTNFSNFQNREGNDEVRNYGALTGVAGMDQEGNLTRQFTVPAIVVPPTRRNARQQLVIRGSFAELAARIKKGKAKVAQINIDVAEASLYLKRSTEKGMFNGLYVVQANTITGRDQKGNALYWSILDHPVEQVEVEPEVAPAPRSNRSRSWTRPAPTPEPSPVDEGVMAMSS